MEQVIYQIDAFASQVFKGNPAAVCPLKEWLSDELMLKIAQENNLSETAFYIKNDIGGYDIRWFTPTLEVDLCGHATLATAYVLFTQEGHTDDTILFYSHRSGELIVTRQQDWFCMNFPIDNFSYVSKSDQLIGLFDIKPKEIWKGKADYLFIYDSQDQIEKIVPNFDAIKKLDARGIIVSAKGKDVDFVSRFFAPNVGVEEDPVTGSAHTTLIPYWAKVLSKTKLSACQLSARGGFLKCEYNETRVDISGQCSLFLKGCIYLG